jgi:8-oxo-dGTP diphosphatase
MSPRYQNPALATDAVWIRAGKVLLVRRGRPPFRGFWALPGGFVELRETVEGALARELQEETGLVGRPVRLIGVYSGPHRDPRKPTTSVAFLVTGRTGPPTGGDDAAFAAWVPLSEARPLAFDHARILADGVRMKRTAAKSSPPRSGRTRGRRDRRAGNRHR